MVLSTPTIITHSFVLITNYSGESTHHIVKTYPKLLSQIRYIYVKPQRKIPIDLFHPEDIPSQMSQR